MKEVRRNNIIFLFALFSNIDENRSLFNEKPVQYAMCLFLTGQFETAIDLLNQIEQFRCHAVHIGIYLHECRLLSTASKSDSPMCKNLW